MQTDETNADRQTPPANGHATVPFGADDTDKTSRPDENKHTKVQENSANGLGPDVHDGQDGRNERAIGSTDMDSENGLLRTGDQDGSKPMQVPEEALTDAARSDASTKTGMVDVTTSGPDDYGSANKVGVPVAQEEAKKQDDAEEKTPADADAANDDKSEDDVAQTGTDLNNKPAY